MARARKATAAPLPVAPVSAEDLMRAGIDRASPTWRAVMAYADALKQSAVIALLRVPRYTQAGLADREGADDFYRGLAAAADRFMAFDREPIPPDTEE